MNRFTRAMWRTLPVLFCFSALSVFAQVAPEPPVKGTNPIKTLRMLDARVNYPQGAETALNARLEAARTGLTQARTFAGQINTAAQALRTTGIPGLAVRVSPYTAGIEMIRNERGSLTPASGGTSTAIVRNFLTQHGDVFGLAKSDVDDLVVLGDSAGGYSGLRMLRMEQQINGRPIFQSETRFILTSNGRLMQGAGRLVPHARSFAGGISGANYMPPGDAFRALMSIEGKTIAPAKITLGAVDATHAELTVDDDYIAGTVGARQVLFPLAPGLVVPAWSLYVTTTGEAAWYAVVDAETGAVLWRKNVRAYASLHDARFRVYVQADGVTPADSPAPASPNAFAVGSGTQAAAIPPTIVSMHTAMDATASPNGWIDDCPGGVCTANESQTLGNNTLTCLDRVTPADVCDTVASSVLDGNGRPTGNPDANARNRDFLGTAPRDFQTNFLPPPQGGNPEAGQTATGNGSSGTAAVDQFRRGAVTHLFYLTNWYHDKLYRLGFDEAAGNFQQTNFSGQGAGGDRVLGDAQDASGTNNANFSTFPDGTSGRMQMYRFTGPTIDRDGALDADVVLHELTHGTSNRLVGDAAGLNWDPAAGMGEGWSDFFALSLLNNTNADDPNGRYAAGAYATYKFISTAYLDNYVYGIRRFGYSTANNVDPLTWADVDDVTNDMSGGIPVSPVSPNSAGGMEVHNIGEVWALTLWEMRSRIIADPAGANGDVPTGNQTSLQLVTDALKMTPVDPKFTDARDAILDADCATNACANEDSIWGAFADRELGYGAYTPFFLSWSFFSSHMAVHTSTSLPYLDVVDKSTDVTIDDSADNNNGAIDPGEAIKMTVKLTNPWRRATKAVTSATATLTSSTPGVTIYDNTSTYGAIAPLGSATGDTFTFTVAPSVTAGSTLAFDLSVTSNLGTTVTSFTVRVGTRNGTDAPVTYSTTPNVAIPDGNQLGAKSPMTITDDYEIADVDFRVDSLTHTYDGDLNLMLRSPNAVGEDVIGLIGLLVAPDQFGSAGANLTNMVIDDEGTGDMFAAPDTEAPYTGSYVPIYNSPSWITGFGVPGDPKGTLSYQDGTSTKGTWNVLAADHATPDSGTLNTWSLIVTPVHFDVAAFVAGANVTATKTVSGTFRVGGTVTYTVTLTNNGTANQGDNPGNEFADSLPSGVTFVSVNATSGTAANVSNIVTWNGTLAPLGGTVTITITATVNAGTQGTVISNQGAAFYDADNNGTNEATVSTDDPSVGGATDPTNFTVGNANFTGTKTASGTFKSGSTVTYTVTLTNSGNSATLDNSGNEFSDTLPASLTLVSANATSGTAATAGNTVTWNGSISSGGIVTITITATINAAAPGTVISNQGTINYDADLDGTNESSTTTDDPSVGGANDATSFTVQGATLAATKTVSGTFSPGGAVTYTITINNTGTAATTDNPGNELTDILPASLTLVSASATSGTATPTVISNTVTWNGGVPASGSVTITINATVNPGTASGTVVSNQASLAYDSDGDNTNETTASSDDPAVGGTSDPTNFTVNGATVTATKTRSGSTAVGGAVTYTITLTNSGNVPAGDNPGNEFTDVLPASLTLVSASASSGNAVATVGTNTVTWNGAVPASGSVTITINATVDPGTQGQTISNQGSFSYDSDNNGTNESNGVTDDPSVGGTSDPTSFVATGASETVTKTVTGSFVTGTDVTYTLVIHNAGNIASGDNPGNELTDILPAELTLVSASATSGTATATVATNTVTWNGSVPAGGDVTITIVATIEPGHESATISNQATLSYDTNGDGTNDATTTSDSPAAGGTNDPTTFSVAAAAVATPIPTASELGLLMLALGLAALAAWKLTLR